MHCSMTHPPSHERILYVAAARVYADAFRAAFVDPEGARRRFRDAVDWDQPQALRLLRDQPEEFGTRRHRAPTGAAHDPALIYWTMRCRRPRALLYRIADEIRAEARRRERIAAPTSTAPEAAALPMMRAARLIAALRRRRDRDQIIPGACLPPLHRQVEAMLPDDMRELVQQAFRMSTAESGVA